MAHALIVGSVGVGKSTLISKVLAELNVSVSGFETRKEERLRCEKGIPLYIHIPGQERHYTDENLLGWCFTRNRQSFTETFDRYAAILGNSVGCDVIKMDEIGFMEAGSQPFCDAIMRCLDGDIPVIAAVKDKEMPFLDSVRSHPNCKCFYITRENRDALCQEVLEYMRAQLS